MEDDESFLSLFFLNFFAFFFFLFLFFFLKCLLKSPSKKNPPRSPSSNSFPSNNTPGVPSKPTESSLLPELELDFELDPEEELLLWKEEEDGMMTVFISSSTTSPEMGVMFLLLRVSDKEEEDMVRFMTWCIGLEELVVSISFAVEGGRELVFWIVEEKIEELFRNFTSVLLLLRSPGKKEVLIRSPPSPSLDRIFLLFL